MAFRKDHSSEFNNASLYFLLLGCFIRQVGIY